MIQRILLLGLGLFALIATGCATRKDVTKISTDMSRLESKIDKLLIATNRDSLEAIFGAQASSISTNIDELDETQRQRFDDLQTAYQAGSVTLEDVREKMLTLLGGGDRQVYTPSGIVIRDREGVKSGSVSNGTKIANCKKLPVENIPAVIAENKALTRYDWGTGEIEGESVIFPWDLTISSFTKEIVEATARRTAEEFMKMGGEGQFNRPIYVKIETEGNDYRVTADGIPAEEVHLVGPDQKGTGH